MHTRKRAYAQSIVGPARLGLEATQCTVRAGAAACAIRHQRGPGPSPSISLSTSLSLGLASATVLASAPLCHGLRQGRAFQQE